MTSAQYDQEWSNATPEIEWEDVTKENRGTQFSVPMISVRKTGDTCSVHINQLCLKRMGDPVYVTIQVSRDGRYIAVAGQSEPTVDAFKISGNSVSSNVTGKKLGMTNGEVLRGEATITGNRAVALLRP